MLTQLYQIGSKVKQGYFNSISNAREIPILESRSSIIEVGEPKTAVHKLADFHWPLANSTLW